AALRDDYPDSIVLTDGRAAEHGLPTLDVGLGNPVRRRDQAVVGPDADHVACIAFTSGTTGRPVGHARRWGTLMRQAAAIARRFELTGPRTVSVVATVPHTHMYGFETTILLPLRASVAIHGGTPLYPDDVRSALDA